MSRGQLHGQLACLLIWSGSATLYVATQVQVVRSGQLCWILPGVPHVTAVAKLLDELTAGVWAAKLPNEARSGLAGFGLLALRTTLGNVDTRRPNSVGQLTSCLLLASPFSRVSGSRPRVRGRGRSQLLVVDDQDSFASGAVSILSDGQRQLAPL